MATEERSSSRRSSTRKKRVYWPIIFPLGIVLLGIYHVPFAWRELRADIVAMPTKPLFADVQALPKMTIGQWEAAVAQLNRSVAIQPRHPDHLTMLGRLYLVRASGLPPGDDRQKYGLVAQSFLRAALKDRPFHKETLALIKEGDVLLAQSPGDKARLADSGAGQPVKPQSK